LGPSTNQSLLRKAQSNHTSVPPKGRDARNGEAFFAPGISGATRAIQSIPPRPPVPPADPGSDGIGWIGWMDGLQRALRVPLTTTTPSTTHTQFESHHYHHPEHVIITSGCGTIDGGKRSKQVCFCFLVACLFSQSFYCLPRTFQLDVFPPSSFLTTPAAAAARLSRHLVTKLSHVRPLSLR
jgi:hypothetical protein